MQSNGLGRNDPNMAPYCPPPEGRIKFSLNPIEMFKQLVGPNARKFMLQWCLIIYALVFCAAFGPGIIISLGSKVLL